MIVAYLCEPQRGGTFTFFQNIRKGLLPLGIDVRCVPPVPRRLYEGSYYMNYEGVDYLDLPEDIGAATRAVVEHLKSIGAQIVIMLPGCDLLSTNLPRYLPREMRCLTRVPGNNRGALAPIPQLLPDLNRVVAVSDRIRADLVEQWNVEGQHIEVIHNGVEVKPLPERKNSTGPLELVYTGRLDDSHKGVFLLFDIMAGLKAAGVKAHLTVVGSGPDGDTLRDRIDAAGLRPMISQMGAVKSAEVEPFLRRADIFVLPTRYEGSPNSLMEAMAAGCVPVVTKLIGITDIILQNGRCGMLVNMGDAAGFCQAIQKLDRDRSLLASMRSAAHQEVSTRYTIQTMSERYESLFRTVVKEPERRRPAAPLDQFVAEDLLQPTWRTHIPVPLKNKLRGWLEQARLLRTRLQSRLKYSMHILSHESKPFKFLLARLLVRSGLNQHFTISQPGYRLRFQSSNLSSVLWIYPDHDAAAQEFLRRYLRPGDLVVDIGANIGNLVMTSSRVVGPLGIVHAVEAHPRIFRYLKENVLLNGATNVMLHETALGSTSGTVFFSDELSDDKNRIRPDGGQIQVPMTTVDKLLPSLKDIALMKIDVEGYEREVFKGATTLLQRAACVVFECWDEHCVRFGHTADDVMAVLRQAGFEIFRSTSDGGWELVAPGATAPRCENYAAIRNVSDFEQRTGWTLPA